MKFAIIAEVAVIILAGALTLAAPASAETTNRDCWSMAGTVKAALNSHPNASESAWSEYRAGTDACSKGFNAFGVAHLQAAMKALGG